MSGVTYVVGICCRFISLKEHNVSDVGPASGGM
jgi:hypothetical protein